MSFLEHSRDFPSTSLCFLRDDLLSHYHITLSQKISLLPGRLGRSMFLNRQQDQEKVFSMTKTGGRKWYAGVSEISNF